MKKLIVEYLKKFHHFIPFGIRRVYDPFIKLARITASFLLPIYYFEGEEHTSGSPIKLAYLGRDNRILNYWVERFLRPDFQVRKTKLIPIWRVNAFFKDYAAQNEVDIAIIEINKITRKFIKNKPGFILPRWLETYMMVDKSFNIMDKGDVSRRIRKNSLSAEIRNSVEDFHFFYERMFKPYISMRHKEAAVIPDYKYFLNIFKKKGSYICFIRLDGELVAGSIFAYFKGVPKLTALGIIDGREDIKRLGVIGALYYFQVIECQHQNIEKLFLGGTSPILTDGLTKFKLALGSEATEAKYFENQFLWLLPFTDSKAVREILHTNPFISLDENRLNENIFVDIDNGADEKNLIDLIEHTKSDNIHSTKVFCFNNKDLVSKWIENSQHIEVEVLDFANELNSSYI